MPIRLKYDVVGVPLSEAGVSPAKRKFGQELIGQQQKYNLETKQQQQQQIAENQKANRNFARDLQMDQNKRQFEGDAEKERRRLALEDRNAANARQDSLRGEDRDWRQAQEEKIAQRQAEKEALMAERADLRDAIENNEFDSVTSRKLKDLELDEMNARAGRSKDGRIDAKQQAEALEKIQAERAVLVQNRIPRKAPPSTDDQIKSRTSKDGRQRIQPGGVIEDVPPPPQQGPVPSWQGFRENPKAQADYQERARNELTQGGLKPQGADDPEAVNRRAAELWDIDEKYRQAPPPQAPSIEPSYSATGESTPPAFATGPVAMGSNTGEAAGVPQAAQPAPAQPLAGPPVAPVQEKIRDSKGVDRSKEPIGTRLRDEKGRIVVKTARFKWEDEANVQARAAQAAADATPAAGQQKPVADSGLTDEQFKAAMEQMTPVQQQEAERASEVAAYEAELEKQRIAKEAITAADMAEQERTQINMAGGWAGQQQFQNNVPVVGPNGASGNLMPGGVSGVQGNRQFRDQTEMEMALRGAGQPDAPKPVVVPAAADAASAVPETAPVVSPEVGKFFDSKIGVAKNADEKLKYSAIQSFVSKGQSPEVTNALMVSLDDKASKQDKLNALQFLLSKGVSISDIVKRAPPEEPSRQGHGYRPPGSRY